MCVTLPSCVGACGGVGGPTFPSVTYFCTFRIKQFPTFTALCDVPHPSAHLRTGCEPESRQLFVDAFSTARELNCNPCATPDVLCNLLDENVRLRQQCNAEAISELQLPDCKGSWFSEKYRHLRYSDWTRVMPVYMEMMRTMSIALFHQYIRTHNREACSRHRDLR